MASVGALARPQAFLSGMRLPNPEAVFYLCAVYGRRIRMLNPQVDGEE